MSERRSSSLMSSLLLGCNSHTLICFRNVPLARPSKVFNERLRNATSWHLSLWMIFTVMVGYRDSACGGNVRGMKVATMKGDLLFGMLFGAVSFYKVP